MLSKTADKVGEPTALHAPPGTRQAGEGASPAPETPLSATSVPAPAPAAAPQQSVSRQGSRGGRSSAIFPIESLSPYMNNWTIKALVTQKSDLKTWSNARGEGKLFSVVFVDDSGEIKATAFNQAAEDFHGRLQEGKVYLVSKARVGLAKKKFNNVTNDYELTLERNTEVEEVTGAYTAPS